MRDIVLYEIRKSIEEINELELSPSDIIDGDQSEQEQLLVDTVRKLIDLSYVARKEGLLALEEKAGVLPDTNGYDTLKMLLMLTATLRSLQAGGKILRSPLLYHRIRLN